ncbi:MAG: hypothetical protein MPF33_05520 [Candidatus Aramenus sp.]|jgi:hypothetical protein|nr:hypothetical protein [Candidatus Aramenus sp.]
MSTDEIRRIVMIKLKELDPNASEAWKFYDRIMKGRITFDDGKAIVVEKGHLYLGRKVSDFGGKGLINSDQVKEILDELQEDLDYGLSKATINARLYALFMGVLRSKQIAQRREREISQIDQ